MPLIQLKIYRAIKKEGMMRVNEEKGMTLLEVIMAISILTIGLLAVAAMQSTSLRGDSFAYSRTEASTYAQDRLEALMAVPYASMTSGVTIMGNYRVTWNLTPSGVSNATLITVTADRGAGTRTIAQLSSVRSSLF
jgi:type IV pilus modification protein PilV